MPVMYHCRKCSRFIGHGKENKNQLCEKCLKKGVLSTAEDQQGKAEELN